jgi:hypothetical protein
MPINSRSKGAKNERLIAKALEVWTSKKFAKSPASGGLNWKTSNVAGDVVCCTEGHYFPFVIEGKSYAKIDFSHLLTPGIKDIEILKYWAQAKGDAVKVNKIPILMMRYNGLPKNFWFLVIEIDFLLYLQSKGLVFNRPSIMFASEDRKLGLVIMRSTDFFKFPYKEIKANAKTYIKQKNKKAAQ